MQHAQGRQIAVLSHDLARALLARRNNDVRIEVLVDDDPTGQRAIRSSLTELRDDINDGSGFHVPATDVMSYDAAADCVDERDSRDVRTDPGSPQSPGG